MVPPLLRVHKAPLKFGRFIWWPIVCLGLCTPSLGADMYSVHPSHIEPESSTTYEVVSVATFPVATVSPN